MPSSWQVIYQVTGMRYNGFDLTFTHLFTGLTVGIGPLFAGDEVHSSAKEALLPA